MRMKVREIMCFQQIFHVHKFHGFSMPSEKDEISYMRTMELMDDPKEVRFQGGL